MKKSELKKILKPLVTECIRESLLEEGLISGIITEVVKGMGAPTTTVTPPNPVADPLKERMRRNAFKQEQSQKIQEHKAKLRAAIGGNQTFNGVDLFEGTTPMSAEASPQQQASPLAGQAPGDAGVDITNLFGSVGRHWNAHMDEVKEGK